MLEDIRKLAALLSQEGVVVDPSRPVGNSALRGSQLTWSTVAAATIADTNETTLWTYTLPANTLKQNGQTLRIQAFGQCADNANTKTIKLYFGANSHTVVGGAAQAVQWWTDWKLIRTGNATQQRRALSGFGGTVNAPSTSSATEDLTGDIVIKITGTNGTASADDITFASVTVELV